MSFVNSSINPINPSQHNNSLLELSNGEKFCWNPFEKVSFSEIDRRIVQLSQNPPKIIKNNNSIKQKIGEMASIFPLRSIITITPEIDAKNRATILFFEVIGRHYDCKPMQLFLNKKKINRSGLNSIEADFLAREMRFFIRRIANQSKQEDRNFSYQETLDGVVELDFDGYHLEFLPKEIKFFKNVREIRVVGCDLTEIPRSIGKLKNLKRINLNGNQLEHLPSTITDCPQLHCIDLLSNKLSYSTLFSIAKNFLSKGNPWGAMKMATHAIDTLTRMTRTGPNEYTGSPYIDIVDLCKKIIEIICFKDDYDGLLIHIVDAINKIPNESERFDAFLTILEGMGQAKRNCVEENNWPFLNDPFDKTLKLQNQIINQSLEMTNLFSSYFGRHNALCQIAQVLFSIDDYSKGFDIIEQAIQLAHATPTYSERKDAEREQVSSILDELSEKLTTAGKFALAIKAAQLIPFERRRWVALAKIEAGKFL